MAFTIVSSCRMGSKETLLLGFVLLSLIFATNGVEGGWSISKEEDMEMEKQLKLLNKPAIKSIRDEDGSIFDCIGINNQPAFDHPLLKNHSIQMRPSSFPKGMKGETSSLDKHLESGFKSGECPPGTVIIRRTRKEDLIRAKSLTANSPNYNFATVRAVKNSSVRYYGARGELNVYNPTVSVNQFSNGVVWVQNGVASELNSIQVGWTVNPKFNGDNRTRLYAYWTADGYQKTGCFNTLCAGFVQVSQKFTLGQVLSPVSIYGGQQSNLKLLVFQDPKTGNWWLTLSPDNTPVGYWPKSIFTSLAIFASELEWGGEVYSPENEASPPMGSGVFSSGIKYKKTCYIRNMQFVDGSFTFDDPDESMLEIAVQNPNCYNAEYGGYQGDLFRYTMYFGGPGGHNCTSS